MVKGALAKGTLQHGSQISTEVSPDMAPRVGYKQHLLFGMPMIQAFNAEKSAPPFGITFTSLQEQSRDCRVGISFGVEARRYQRMLICQNN